MVYGYNSKLLNAYAPRQLYTIYTIVAHESWYSVFTTRVQQQSVNFFHHNMSLCQ